MGSHNDPNEVVSFTGTSSQYCTVVTNSGEADPQCNDIPAAYRAVPDPCMEFRFESYRLVILVRIMKPKVTFRSFYLTMTFSKARTELR